MTPVFYDTHAHLDYPDFAADLPAVIQRAHAAGITRIISVGTDLASSERAIQLSDTYPAVFAAVGWHPSDADRAPDDVRPALRQLARHPKVVAIGETGLDYHRLPSQQSNASAHADDLFRAKQNSLFLQHLEVAAECGLNCIIHQRDAFEDVWRQVQAFASRVRGVFHCFVDDHATAQRILAAGSLVSFTGIVTFKNAQNVRGTLAAIPLEAFLLETDCPFLAPVPYRGQRCEPAYVRDLAQTIAQVKGCSLDELSAATCATAREFFKGPAFSALAAVGS